MFPLLALAYNIINFYSPLGRCYILENDTVQCDTDLYKSLQAWKDHKLHIDHEVSDFLPVICMLHDDVYV